jgi:proteic killer suppression protein
MWPNPSLAPPIGRDLWLLSIHLPAHRRLLLISPCNHLEKLQGDRAGQWSIRINDQWRVCFRFEDGDALDVEIVDYH